MARIRSLAGCCGLSLIHLIVDSRSQQPWEVQNVPPFDRRDPKHVPGRAQFLWRNTIKSAICVVLLDFSQSLGRDPTETSYLFSSSRIPFFARLGGVTREEVVLRYIISVMFWANAYILIELCHCAPAILTVALGASKIDSWRPFFGSLADCWSVRQFWGYARGDRPRLIHMWSFEADSDLSDLSGISRCVKC